MSKPRPTAWFDGGCPLCRCEISLIKRLDGRSPIRLVDLAECQGDCPIDRKDLLANNSTRGKRVNVIAVPEWSAPGEKLLKGFVAKLGGERSKLIAFKEPKPPAPGPRQLRRQHRRPDNHWSKTDDSLGAIRISAARREQSNGCLLPCR
jgi:hypothetical protein